MPFPCEEHAGDTADGAVLAVDVTHHARQLGFHGQTLVSRGVWATFVGAGADREEHLLATLRTTRRIMSNPGTIVNEDGSAMLFGLCGGTGGPVVKVVSVMNDECTTLMLWGEFEHRPPGPTLLVRVVAEDEAETKV
jgi:hypothetical protein